MPQRFIEQICPQSVYFSCLSQHSLIIKPSSLFSCQSHQWATSTENRTETNSFGVKLIHTTDSWKSQIAHPQQMTTVFYVNFKWLMGCKYFSNMSKISGTVFTVTGKTKFVISIVHLDWPYPFKYSPVQSVPDCSRHEFSCRQIS